MPRDSDQGKKSNTRRIKLREELGDLKLVMPDDLWSDNGTAFPAPLMTAFKKEKEACARVKALGKEWHKVTKYLAEHMRWEPANLKKYDDTGTLSHMLMLLMVDFNKELTAKGMKLPGVAQVKQQLFAETDAERQAEFCQDIQTRHQRSQEEEEIKRSSVPRETTDHYPSTERREPTPRSHSSSSDRWRRYRHKSRERSRSKRRTRRDHNRSQFAPTENRRLVEWKGSHRRSIERRAKEGNAYPNLEVKTMLKRGRSHQLDTEPYRNRGAYELHVDSDVAYGSRRRHQTCARRKERDTSHHRNRLETQMRPRERRRSRERSRIDVPEYLKRRETRSRENRPPRWRSSREDDERSRRHRGDVVRRPSERRTHSEEAHTYSGWSRTSKSTWGRNKPVSRPRAQRQGAWDSRRYSGDRERTPERRNERASEGQQNQAAVNLAKTFLEAVSQSQAPRASGKKSAKDKEERNLRK